MFVGMVFLANPSCDWIVYWINFKPSVMKKFLFVGMVFLLAFMKIKAQMTHAQFGLKGGVNVATIKVNAGNDYDSRTGFYLGGLAHIHVTKHFAVQPEVVYSTEGGEMDNDFKTKLDYINVPVLAQLMCGNGFRLQTGPQIGFLLSGKNESNDVEENVKDQLKTADLAWSFGASYISKSGLGVDARYNLGLTDINNSPVVEAKTRTFQVGAFYQFMH